MPSVTVRIPSQIARLYGTDRWEQVDAADVAAAIAALNARFPGMGERLTEPDGRGGRRMRRWVNAFVDGTDIRSLAGMETPLAPGAELYLVPSVAGG